MTTEADFLGKLAEDGFDPAVRLALADWLEEHGETDAAEWVRLDTKWQAGPSHLIDYFRLTEEERGRERLLCWRLGETMEGERFRAWLAAGLDLMPF